MMTLHCAKGLEFRCVFLVGLEDGMIPSRQNFDDGKKIEEERRLLYVGITRAMQRLECSHVDYRWRFGDLIPGYPSRFLQSIPQSLYTFRDRSNYFGEPPAVITKKKIAQSAHSAKHAPSTSVSTAPAAKPAYDRDDFSQDTVEFRMGTACHAQNIRQGKDRIDQRFRRRHETCRSCSTTGREKSSWRSLLILRHNSNSCYKKLFFFG